MCHRFLPVPLSSGAVMRIRGPGPILRASIHISGPGRVQSACVYTHTRIHIYMHTPAHRCAAGLPQGPGCAPMPAPVSFVAPGTHLAPPPTLFQDPARFGSDLGVAGAGRFRPHPPSLVLPPAALGGDALRWPSVAAPVPGNPLAEMLSGGHLAPHLSPSYALASPSSTAPVRLRRGVPVSVVPPSPAPRPRNAPAQPQSWRPICGRFRRGLGVIRARPRSRPGRGSGPSQKKM